MVKINRLKFNKKVVEPNCKFLRYSFSLDKTEETGKGVSISFFLQIEVQ